MIDLIASQPQYGAHLDPVFEALPTPFRGDRIQHRAERRHDAVLVASIRDLAAARRLGYERIAYLEHGIGQSYGNGSAGYPGGKGRGSVGLFLSPNETAAESDRRAYPEARVEVVGDPRLDTLPALEGPPGTAVVSFHWQCGVAPETRPAYPHFRRVLPDLAAAVPLIAHAHPRARVTMEPVWRRLGIEFVESFDEVCRRASVYVCDNSSTIYEFASTGRPVVVLNAPFYRRQVSHGLRFWDAADVGVQVDEPEGLVAGVKRAIADTPSQAARRERALDIVYAHRTGSAVRAAGALVDWLQASHRVAA